MLIMFIPTPTPPVANPNPRYLTLITDQAGCITRPGKQSHFNEINNFGGDYQLMELFLIPRDTEEPLEMFFNFLRAF